MIAYEICFQNPQLINSFHKRMFFVNKSKNIDFHRNFYDTTVTENCIDQMI